MIKPTIEPAVLVYAFRYALGRMTYAPSDVQAAILGNLHMIPVNDKLLYIREVEEALNRQAAGMDHDAAGWASFAARVRASLPDTVPA